MPVNSVFRVQPHKVYRKHINKILQPSSYIHAYIRASYHAHTVPTEPLNMFGIAELQKKVIAKYTNIYCIHIRAHTKADLHTHTHSHTRICSSKCRYSISIDTRTSDNFQQQQQQEQDSNNHTHNCTIHFIFIQNGVSYI